MDYKTIQCLLSTRHIDSIGNNTVNIEFLGSTGMSKKKKKKKKKRIKNSHISDFNFAPKIIVH